MVSLFETLAKKHSRLDNLLKQPANGVSLDVQMSKEEMLQDLGVLEEVLRMVLEILNSCLSHQLLYCPNLVYTLLYKKHVFENFRSHHAFQDIIQNIDMVVGFFSSRLQRVQEQRGELGVNEVLEVISKGASQWSSDRLRVSLLVFVNFFRILTPKLQENASSFLVLKNGFFIFPCPLQKLFYQFKSRDIYSL